MSLKGRIERLEDELNPKKRILPPLAFTFSDGTPLGVLDIQKKFRKIERDSGWRRLGWSIVNTVGEYGEPEIQELERNLKRLRENLKGVIDESHFQEVEEDIRQLRIQYNI